MLVSSLHMEENKVHFRHLTFFYFRKGKNVTQATNKICAGECALAKEPLASGFLLRSELMISILKSKNAQVDLSPLMMIKSRITLIENNRLIRHVN